MTSIENIVYNQREAIRQRQQEVEFVKENPELYEEAMENPLMIPGETRVRLGLTGEIYIRSYRDQVETNLEEGDEVTIQKPGEKKRVLVRFSRFDTIEEFLKESNQLKDAYDQDSGEEVMRLRELSSYSIELGDRFKNGEITQDELDNEISMMAAQIVRAKFDTARKPVKKRVSDRFQRAVTRDRLWRPNPSRARLLLAHGNEDLRDELAFTKIVDEKYTYLAHLLHVSRSDQRARLEKIRDHSDLVFNIPEDSNEFENALNLLISDSKVALAPNNTFTNPYALVAHRCRIMINGNTNIFDRLSLEAYTKPKVESFRITENEVRGYMRALPIAGMYSGDRIKETARIIRSELSLALNNGAQALGEEIKTGRGLYDS